MKKRFTDAQKWDDAWFMDLPAKWKLFWLFLTDTCDNAGVWEPNFRLAAFQIGEHFEQTEAMRMFAERITVLENGKWYLNKFIEFQYGSLSETCAPHKQVLKLLERHGIQRVNKGLANPYVRVKDKDKDKDSKSKSKGTLEDLKSYAKERGKPESDGEWFFNSMEAGGWTRGGKPLKDWKAHFRSYAQAGWLPSDKGKQPKGSNGLPERGERNGQIAYDANGKKWVWYGGKWTE